MANAKRDKIIKLYWTRRPYGRGGDESGAYVNYFLEDLVEDIFGQDKVKQFLKFWKLKIEQIKGRGVEPPKTKK